MQASDQTTSFTPPVVPTCSHCGAPQIPYQGFNGKPDWRCAKRHCNILEAQAVVRIVKMVREMGG
jgi:hypothetical protein